jgi:hypothetical protein
MGKLEPVEMPVTCSKSFLRKVFPDLAKESYATLCPTFVSALSKSLYYPSNIQAVSGFSRILASFDRKQS